MIRKIAAIAAVALLAGAVVTTSGCRRVRIAEAPSTEKSSVSYPLAGATTIDADIEVGVGELRVSSDGSGTTAADATFVYSPASWEPITSYDATGGVGTLRMRQPNVARFPELRDATNRWDVRLAGGVPTDLDFVLGVGRSTIDLSRVDIRDLRVVTGVGDATIDLTGARTADVDARIEAGVGDLTIRLPKGVGVRVVGREDGIGRMSADGFTAQGDTWVNDAYSGTGPKIDISLTRGVGNVRLQLVD